MDWTALIREFVTLVVVIDPVGSVPVFLFAVQRIPRSLHRRFAARATAIATLVLNGTPAEVDAYLAPQDVPDNLAVHPRTEDPAGFLAAADLVVNLSRVDLWIETFGLTLIEAMAFGVPVIAPPIGGPVEIVTDGREGWLIDSRDPDKLQTAVTRMADDTALYAKMSAAARDRAGAFTFEAFSQALSAVVRSVQTGEPRP